MLARLLPDEAERRSFVRWALVALAIHLVAALMTEGWYSNDEHWQILEFASAILGRVPRSTLPWEYANKMRPSIQPYLCAGAERVLYGAGIDNPFTIATVLRIIMSLCAWAVTMLAGLVCMSWLRGSPVRKWVMPTLALAWFLPYLHARTSSENASETSFVLGFTLLTLGLGAVEGAGKRVSTTLSTLVGLLLGLACEFRFQTGFMVIGAVTWCVFVARLPIRTLGAMAGGLLLAVAISTAADRAFYGEWTFAPWNYVRVNIIEHQANRFGTSPWWLYFRAFPERLGPPTGFVFVALVFFGWYRRPRSALTFCMVPFLLAHVATAHKETRFLFPLATLSLLMSLLAADDVLRMWPRVAGWWTYRGCRVLAYLMLAENVFLLSFASLRPAQANMPMYRKIYELGKERALTLHYRDGNPYDFDGDLHIRFYAPPNLKLDLQPDGVGALTNYSEATSSWFIDTGFETSHANPGQCDAVERTYPTWLRRFNINHWMDRSPIWTLYSCQIPRYQKHIDILDRE